MVCARCRSLPSPQPKPCFPILRVLHVLTSPAWPLGTFTFATPDMDEKQHVAVKLLACRSSGQPCFRLPQNLQATGAKAGPWVPGNGHYLSFPYKVPAGQELSLSPFMSDETVSAKQTVPGGTSTKGQSLGTQALWPQGCFPTQHGTPLPPPISDTNALLERKKKTSLLI